MKLYVRTKYNNLGGISALVLDSNANELFQCDSIDMKGIVMSIRFWLKFDYGYFDDCRSVQLKHLSKSY